MIRIVRAKPTGTYIYHSRHFDLYVSGIVMVVGSDC